VCVCVCVRARASCAGVDSTMNPFEVKIGHTKALSDVAGRGVCVHTLVCID